MQLTSTLDEEIIEYLCIMRDSIKDRKYWTSFDYNYTYDRLRKIVCRIKSQYLAVSGQTLEEASRRILAGVFGGSIETYISFYNGLLYVRKLENKVRWHQRYGVFPE